MDRRFLRNGGSRARVAARCVRTTAKIDQGKVTMGNYRLARTSSTGGEDADDATGTILRGERTGSGELQGP
jgi:hypothetical protein